MTTSITAGPGQLPSPAQRLADAAVARALRLPKARNPYAVELDLPIGMRDGVDLIGDLYAPLTRTPRGTVLIRTPYGRGFPDATLHGRVLAARGYHVLIQSVRGTFGSGGTFTAVTQETADGHDTVGWLRDQSWFDGRLATLGGSYLGWAQWALLQDPPPEVKTSIVSVGPHDFRTSVFGTGSFTLGDFLGWAHQIAHQEEAGLISRWFTGAATRRRLEPALTGLPLADAPVPALEGRTPWYFDWLKNAENEDFWGDFRAGSALELVDVPVLLVTGWQDLFLEQTLEQYRVLSGRGLDVAMTVGPWNHFGVVAKGGGLNGRDTLSWLDEHLAAIGRRTRPPIRAFRTGEEKWHSLPSWPPATTETSLVLTPAGALAPAGQATQPSHSAPPREGAAAGTGGQPDIGGTVAFRYDPTDPTPSVGGRVMSGEMGVQENRSHEARADVVTFTTERLPADLDLAGSPMLELALAVDNPHADVFVRLCDVDAKGRSANFSDVLRRLDPRVPAGQVQRLRLTLDQCFHRVPAGHRLRLQVSGGAFPRYARNLGTDGSMADGSRLAPSLHTIHCAQSRLLLPVTVEPLATAEPLRPDASSTTP
jgi:putative CocE/NonD family hydrolase